MKYLLMIVIILSMTTWGLQAGVVDKDDNYEESLVDARLIGQNPPAPDVKDKPYCWKCSILEMDRKDGKVSNSNAVSGESPEVSTGFMQ